MVKLSILGLIFLLYKRGKKSGAREEIKVPQLSIKKQKTSHSYILVNKEEQSKKSKQWFLCKVHAGKAKPLVNPKKIKEEALFEEACKSK